MLHQSSNQNDKGSHTEAEEAMMRQLVKELGPNTPLAKATLAEWKAQKSAARHPMKVVSHGEGIVDIPLAQLEDNPYQLRHDMDSDALEELTRNIEENGLLNPINVRRKGDKYEIISGHRRKAAYQRLQFNAKSDKDKQKYSAISARVLPSVTDEQMLLLGLSENLMRADISPLDAAQGLVTLKKLRPALTNAKKLSDTTGLQYRKVVRLLELADSPEVVQQAVRDGISTASASKGKQSPDDDGEQKQTLDLVAALEFTRLHNALSKKKSDGKSAASSADERTRQAISHALKEGWGAREVMHYVDKAIAGLGAHVATGKPPGRPTEPFRKTDRQLIIYFGRLNAMSTAQRQSLRKVLKEILRQL
jgi:ParB family chromosome partitioning protein